MFENSRQTVPFKSVVGIVKNEVNGTWATLFVYVRLCGCARVLVRVCTRARACACACVHLFCIQTDIM